MIKTKIVGLVTCITSKEKRVSLAYQIEGRMVRVAVSYCSPHDVYSRKIGRDIVCQRIELDYDNITLPMGKFSEPAIQAILVDMFFEFE